MPARERSSTSSWKELLASRKLNFAALWPTLVLSHCVPITATCWARCQPFPPAYSLFLCHSKTRHINETIFPIMFVNEVRATSSAVCNTPLQVIRSHITNHLSLWQTATIDDESASQMKTLLLIVTLVSNFPLLIVGLGIILLLVLVILFCRNRQRKVRSAT